MLSYEKYKGVHLPYTGSRFFFEMKENFILDNHTGAKIYPQDDLWTIPNKKYPAKLTKDELYLLTRKPMYMDQEDFFKSFRTDRIEIIAKPNTNVARNTRFWKLNVECGNYEGYYYIPGFTNYVISRTGIVISLITGLKLKFSKNSTGYPACRMNRDDGKSSYMLLHSLLGVTFKEWDHSIINLVIDHLDADKTNYSLDNIEFVTDAENKRRAHALGLIPSKAKPIYCYDLLTNKVHTFVNQKSASETLKVPTSTIQNHLSKVERNKLLHSRYFLEYRIVGEDGTYIDGFDFDDPNSNKLIDLMNYKTGEGSQPKPVLMKNISTGEITTFPSVVNFIKFSGLTRKQVYPRLKQSLQRRYGDIIFKYADDTSKWIY